ncbi:hypothetical protein ACWIGW_39420 [Nocardia brasiliensis]
MPADDLVRYAAYMIPPRSIIGRGILFDAAVLCMPQEPRHPYFELLLMKVDYRSPERIEYEVSRVEFQDPHYLSGGGYYLAGYYGCQACGTGGDGYYAVLRMYQIHDDGVTRVIADTKPPVRLRC